MGNSSFVKGTIETPVPTNKGGTGLSAVGTAGQVLKTNDGATAIEWGESSNPNIFTGTLGEAITISSNPKSVFLYDNTMPAETDVISEDSGTGDIGRVDSTYWNAGQSFTTPASGLGTMTKISCYIRSTNGSYTYNVACNIYATDGSGYPTGSSLGNGSRSGTITNSSGGANIEFEMSSPVTLTASTKYAFVLTCSLIDEIYTVGVTSGSTYSGGYAINQVNGTWSNQAGQDCRFKIYGYDGLTDYGDIMESDGDDNDRNYSTGFLKTSGVDTDTKDIYYTGVVSGFTGLTVGAYYYLSGTAGEITTTNTGIQVGLAISSTELLIQKA